MDKSRTGKGERWDRVRAAIERSVWLAMGILAIGVLTTACNPITRRAEYSRFASTGIAPGDVITVILYGFSGLDRDFWWREHYLDLEKRPDLEEKVVTCISEAIREIALTVQIIPPEEFRRVALHNLTLAELPGSEKQWMALAADAAFRERVAPLNLRYAIFVHGFKGGFLEREREWWQALGWGGALTWWKDFSRFSATILDVKRAVEVGSVDATAGGKGSLFMSIETRACNDLGEQVAKFLVEETPPGETAGEPLSGESARPPVQENRSQGEQEQGPRQYGGFKEAIRILEAESPT